MTFKMPKPRVYHLANLVNRRGGVSALCFAKPRSINLKAASWTMHDDAVTCRKCLAILKLKDKK